MPRSLLLLITSVFLGCSGGDQSGKKGGGPPTNSDSGTVTGDDTGSSSTRTCATSKDCDAGLVCDRLDGACESCRVTADCDVGQRCSDGSCVVSTACNSDLDCTGDGLVCDTEAGVCVECNSAAECESGGCMHHSCVPSPACKSSLDCADYTMICGEALPPDWPASYAGSACLECMSSADCPNGASCDVGLCFDTCAQAGVICGEYEGADCGQCPNGGVCSETGLTCLEPLSEEFFIFSPRTITDQSIFGYGSDSTLLKINRNNGTSTNLGTFDEDITIKVMAANDQGMYWSDLQTGIIQVDATTGASSKMAGTDHILRCHDMTTTTDALFCAVYANDDDDEGLLRVPLNGGTPQLLWYGITPDAIVASGDYIYYSIEYYDHIGRSPVTGFGYETLLEGYSADEDIQVWGGAVYFSDDQEIHKLDISTQRVTKLSSDGYVAEILGVNSDGIWFLSYLGGAWLLPLSGGQATKRLANDEFYRLAVAEDGTVYATNPNNPTVYVITP